MLRMRTIEQAAAELKQDDPQTAITKYAIRQLVLSGEIPSIRRGNKYLLNLDLLLAYLNGETVTQRPAAALTKLERREIHGQAR